MQIAMDELSLVPRPLPAAILIKRILATPQTDLRMSWPSWAQLKAESEEV